MEKQQEMTLMKPRSYRSVLIAGFRLYTENFRRLFKASWQMALLYAVACGVFGTLSVIKIPEIVVAIIQQLNVYHGLFLETLVQYLITFLQILGLLVVAIATLALASATILNKLKEHKETDVISIPPHWFSASPKMMGRSLKGLFFTLLVILIPIILMIAAIAGAEAFSPQFVANHLITLTATFSIGLLIIILLSLPLFHVLMKYLMEAPCSYWHTLSTSYSRGMRHWGSLFVVFFVSTLLVEIAAFIIMLPAHILNIANQQAQMGVLIGDPLGMPSYMTTLTFITFMLCCFMEFYVSQVMLVHNYYIYGAIESKEQENEQQKLDIQ
jgi:hypothetical protein